MSQHKSPGTTRTSRNVALEKGTDPAGFAGQLFPNGPEIPVAYDENCDLPVSQGQPFNPPMPFSNARKK